MSNMDRYRTIKVEDGFMPIRNHDNEPTCVFLTMEDAKKEVTDWTPRCEVTANTEWRKAYEKHLKSAKWKNTKSDLMKMRGKKCEVCGQYSPKLELHHITYERLGNESAKDLLILCAPCHKKEDKKREQKNSAKRETRRIDSAFMTWCDRLGIDEPNEIAWDRFLQWISRKNGGAI